MVHFHAGIKQIFNTADYSQTSNDKNPTISAIHSKDINLLNERLALILANKKMI